VLLAAMALPASVGQGYTFLGSPWSQPGNITFSYSNLFDGSMSLSGFTDCDMLLAVEEALGLWAAHAPLVFTEVQDSHSPVNDSSSVGGGDIRFGQHDLSGSVLAHAWAPGGGLGGDVHFDSSSRTWSHNLFRQVATHELGHSVGLGHEEDVVAVMNPYANASLAGMLMPDDIDGIQARYGAGRGEVITTRIWAGDPGDGDWATHENWINAWSVGDPSWRPTRNSNVHINGGHTVSISSGSMACRTLTLGYNSADSGTLRITGGALTARKTLTVGKSGSGTIEQLGGTVVTPSLALGGSSGKAVRYHLDGGLLSVSGEITDGSGDGTLRVRGGALSAHGTVTIDQLDLEGMVGGHTFTWDNPSGSLHVKGGVAFGGEAARACTFEVRAGTLAVDGNITDGLGAGTLAIDGGALQVAGRITVDAFRVGDRHDGTVAREGKVTAGTLTVGNYAAGDYTQSGGAHQVAGALTVAAMGGSSGRYELAGGELASGQTIVGRDGEGTFAHSDGTHRVTGDLIVGEAGGAGHYQMTPGGSSGVIGAEFVQTDTVDIGGVSYTVYEMKVTPLTDWTNARMELTLASGTLYQDEAYGSDTEPNPAMFPLVENLRYDTYAAAPAGYPALASFAGERAVDETHFNVSWFDTGNTGPGMFTIAQLTLSSDAEGDIWARVYDANPGSPDPAATTLSGLTITDGRIAAGTVLLIAPAEYVGYHGTGTFDQAIGTNMVGALYIGRHAGSVGTYIISGGALLAGEVHVGVDGEGTLAVTGPTADITVTGKLSFGTDSTFTAVAGTEIHMIGAAMENESTYPVALGGLGNTTLVFDGGAVVNPMEVAGAIDGGLVGNFALGALVLGRDDVGWVGLVDAYDNGRRGAAGRECLFVHALDIGEGSWLDVNGLPLYVAGDVAATLDGWIADGTLIDSTGAAGLDAAYIAASDWTVVLGAGVMPGDANGDGFADDYDLAILLGNWGSAPLGWAMGDFTGDGVVDDSDISVLLASWTGPPPAGGTPVPAPASLLLLGLGAVATRRRRRR